MATPTKVKYRLRPLPHSVVIHSVSRDVYGAHTETDTTVDAYVEVAPAVRVLDSGDVKTFNGFVLVNGDVTVSVGDTITVSGVKRKIVDIGEVRGFSATIKRKELFF